MKKILIVMLSEEHEKNDNAFMSFDLSMSLDATLSTCVIPKKEAYKHVVNAVQRVMPSVVILLDVTPSITQIKLEWQALNKQVAMIRDRQQSGLVSVDEDGPEYYLTTLPVDSILADLVQKKHLVSVSIHPDIDLSNTVFYQTKHFLRDTDIQCGLLRVPQHFDLSNDVLSSVIKATVTSYSNKNAVAKM